MIIPENYSRDMTRQSCREGVITCSRHLLLNKLIYIMYLYDITVDSVTRMGSDKRELILGVWTSDDQAFKRRSLSGRFDSLFQ
jgi:hypothetical protein